MLMSVAISKRKENADDYMTAGNRIGFGISAASMTATWIWASSMYASVTAGYTYGVSGPIHYGLWGALMILFIYPFGKRIRAVAPRAHTLAEVMYARHGRSSQLMLAGSNVLGSVISLTSNFIAGGAIISLLSPISFGGGIVIVAAGVLLYTLWSGFRASVLTDFAQVCAMLGAAVIIIPVVFFAAGGPEMFEAGRAAGNVTPAQESFFSSEAFMQQGAPYIAAVLAYAIGNQTIAQRLFAVRQDLIKPTFVTATIGYGSSVIGIGMIGVMALYLGVQPLDGDVNNLLPQMTASYLPAILVAVAFVMIIGSLSSTADSDLSALSSIVMTDIYGQSVGRRKADPRTMLLIGRATMIIATGAALYFATARFNILDLLVFVGALWGCLVFPVIASFYWKKVTNRAFTVSVLAALAVFIPVRFELVPLTGVWALAVEALAIIGVGVVLGIMAFGFFGLRPAVIVGAAATVATGLVGFDFLREYTVLSASLVAYAVSFLVCWAMSVRSHQDFDFDVIQQITGDFDPTDDGAADTDFDAELRTLDAADGPAPHADEPDRADSAERADHAGSRATPNTPDERK
ncbi:sodium:solute symporter family protein [Brevibacterium sp. Re57]|uniref:Sodium:solute symporter family protein n=2 Tax=Brevibacterium gallinarum TaxID=2762220 RepID=A0ABR8WT52_9MICO|nr:sodium:solute symporter family protein [Brevibacterium gallinarum]MBD8020252.1 sodium:solute symporter family protein [Brevibacterium gallinarum]